MLIGYQGEIGSNAEEASKQYSNTDTLIPLTTSKGVVDALISGNIQIGVLAYRNSIAGEVIETKEALKNIDYTILEYIDISINHYLFKKPNIEENKLKYVASHIQALKQTSNWRKDNIPNLEEVEMVDTAIAARLLSEGVLDDTYAVICRKNAGLMYNLELMASNIENDKTNTTTFVVIRL